MTAPLKHWKPLSGHEGPYIRLSLPWQSWITLRSVQHTEPLWEIRAYYDQRFLWKHTTPAATAEQAAIKALRGTINALGVGKSAVVLKELQEELAFVEKHALPKLNEGRPEEAFLSAWDAATELRGLAALVRGQPILVDKMIALADRLSPGSKGST